MNETFQRMLNSLGSWSLRVLGFLAILIVGWIIAKALGRIVDRLLARVGFNRLAQRTKMRRWTGRYEPSALVGKVVYYAALLFTFQIAFNVFGPNPVSDIISTIISWLPRLLVASVIMVVAIAIANAVFDIVNNALSQFSYGRILGRAAQVIIIALGAIAALNQIGIATTVTTPVLIAVLATIGGILVVGVGGGLIMPMRERWERMLNKAENEGGKVAESVRSQQASKPAARLMKPGDERMAQPGYSGMAQARDVKEMPERAAGQAGEQAAGQAGQTRQPGQSGQQPRG